MPATLLGEPVIVTELTEDDATFELRARCARKSATGLVSYADLGTVEAGYARPTSPIWGDRAGQSRGQRVGAAWRGRIPDGRGSGQLGNRVVDGKAPARRLVDQ
jgi:hypothetical protein